MSYATIILFLIIGCAGQTAPTSNKQDHSGDNGGNAEQEGAITDEQDTQLADVPEITRLEEVSQLRLDTNEFAVTGLTVNHFTFNDHLILSLSYDLNPESDYVQILRCRDAVRIDGETMELGQALAIEDQDQREDAFRSNLFWQNALENCFVLADHFIRKTILDSSAPSGEYYYLARSCVDSSRISIDVEGQTSRNCSRIIEKSSSIIYDNVRSQDVLEAMEALSWQINNVHKLMSESLVKTEQLSRTLLICQKKEEQRVVSYAKAKALASVISQGVGIFAGLGTLKGSLKELKAVTKTSKIKGVNGGKDLKYSTRERGVDGGQETFIKYDKNNVKFSQDNISGIIRQRKAQADPTGTGKSQSLSHDDTIQQISDPNGSYDLSAIRHVRSSKGSTENLTVFGKDSQGRDVSFTARRSNVDGSEWTLDRNLPGNANKYGTVWGRSKDSMVFKDNDAGTAFDPSGDFKQAGLVKSLVTGKGGWSDRTSELQVLAGVQSVRQATIMPLITTEIFSTILTKGSHIKTNCVGIEKQQEEINIINSKLDQSQRLQQKLEELKDIRINKWNQTKTGL